MLAFNSVWLCLQPSFVNTATALAEHLWFCDFLYASRFIHLSHNASTLSLRIANEKFSDYILELNFCVFHHFSTHSMQRHCLRMEMKIVHNTFAIRRLQFLLLFLTSRFIATITPIEIKRQFLNFSAIDIVSASFFRWAFFSTDFKIMKSLLGQRPGSQIFNLIPLGFAPFLGLCHQNDNSEKHRALGSITKMILRILIWFFHIIFFGDCSCFALVCFAFADCDCCSATHIQPFLAWPTSSTQWNQIRICKCMFAIAAPCTHARTSKMLEKLMRFIFSLQHTGWVSISGNGFAIWLRYSSWFLHTIHA